MSIVERNRDGRITAVFGWQVEQIAEEPSDNHPDIAGILALVGHTLGICQDLGRSDSAMSRVLEDLIEFFVEKRMILVSDLLAGVMIKISYQRNLRKYKRALASLLSDDTDKTINAPCC